jgi:hypothetical protein
MADNSAKPDPQNILALLIAFRQSKTMFDAVSLGVSLSDPSLPMHWPTSCTQTPTRWNGCSTRA